MEGIGDVDDISELEGDSEVSASKCVEHVNLGIVVSGLVVVSGVGICGGGARVGIHVAGGVISNTQD